MPAARCVPKPKVQILTRRSGIHANPLLNVTPIVEIAEVFRIDVIGEAFEGFPDAPHYVRFVFNQEQFNVDNWELYDPRRRPHTPEYEESSSFEFDEDDFKMTLHQMQDSLGCVLFYNTGDLPSGRWPLQHAQYLAQSPSWRQFWRDHPVTAGYTDFLSIDGLMALRNRVQNHDWRVLAQMEEEFADADPTQALLAMPLARSEDQFFNALAPQ